MSFHDESSTSVTAPSSSGVETTFDVAVFCSSPKLRDEIELELTSKNYQVAKCLIGGRDIISNLMTCAKHSKTRIVCLDKNSTECQTELAPLRHPSYFPLHSTLVLHDTDVKTEHIQSYFRTFQRMKIDFNCLNVVKHAIRYIESVALSDDLRIVDPGEKMELFAFLLVCDCLKSNSGELTYLELTNQCERQIGKFRQLAVKGLKNFLINSQYFKFEGSDSDSVLTTKEGNYIFSKWNLRVIKSNEDPPLSHLEVTSLVQEHRGEKFNPQLHSVCEEVQDTDASRVEKWVKESNDPLPVEKEVPLISDQEKSFKIRMNLLDTRLAFFLISSKLDQAKHLKSISKIPFLQVFDFDPDSRTSGLLGLVENQTKENKRLIISDLSDAVQPISDQSISWVFMKGMREKASNIHTGNCYRWKKQYFKIIQEHCENMMTHCLYLKTPVFLVTWFDQSEESAQYLQELLTYIDQVFSLELNDLSFKMVLCVPSTPETYSRITEIEKNLDQKVIDVTENTLGLWLKNLETPNIGKAPTMCLPKRHDDGTLTEVPVPRQELAWVKDLLEIVSPMEEIVARTNDDIAIEFVKGGTVAWDSVSMHEIAVERDIHQRLCDFILESIEECKSTIIRILHSPGGGGTTFGRQIIWELRKSAPCCVMEPTLIMPLSDLVERINWLHQLTQLPVVILVDGRSDFDVERLYTSRKFAVVIIHVQRYCLEIKRSQYEKGGCCYLAGNVNIGEANQLSKVFTKFAPESKTALTRLAQDVSKNRPREVFEFGLAAFNHEFKGVKSYVRGYMEPKADRLQSWQRIVGYLSLLMYYGQCGIPGEVFRPMLTDTKRYVSRESLHAGKQFVNETKGYWKINYNAVAKEILEFVLALRGDASTSKPGRLSKQAQGKLHWFVIEFIRYIKSRVGKMKVEKLLKPLFHMVTTRDYVDVDITDGKGKKNMLSRLLDDIISQEDRITVMEELTKAFPDQPECLAHLGRICSMYKKFDDAETYLTKAVELRVKERKERDPEQRDNVRARLHHMFGYSYLRRVEYERDCNRYREALTSAQLAVDNFTQGRRYVVQNRLYGYLGEVRVRLLMVEIFNQKYNIARIFNGPVNKEDVRLRDFVKESHSVCDQILVECQQYTTSEELRNLPDYFKCVNKFNVYFKEVQVTLETLDDTYPDIPLVRSKIAAIKMKHSSGRKNHIDDISDKKDIKTLVQLLSKTIVKVLSNDLYDRLHITVEMQEWLDAIRHRLVPDQYDLIDVLQKMEQWESRKEFGFATFYLYVVHFLMAMFSAGEYMRKQHLKNAEEIAIKMRSKYEQHYIKSKELLADHDKLTIRKLIPRHKMGSWQRDRKTWSNSEATSKLKVCTGTVVKSSQPLIGFISLDLDVPLPKSQVRLFFSPKKYELHGTRFSEQCTRVEFFIGFNTNNGAEAESIKVLEKALCRNCKTNSEIITLNQQSGGTCTKCSRRIA